MAIPKRFASCAKRAAAILLFAVLALALFPSAAYAVPVVSDEDGVLVFECSDGEFTAVYNGFAALDSNGNMYLIGPYNYPAPPKNLPPIKDIALGSQHVVALDIYGEIHYWGNVNPDDGQLDFPENLPEIVDIEAEGAITLLLTADGEVLSVGTPNQGTQHYVPNMPRVTKIGTSYYVSVALAEDGTVYGWRLLNSPPPIETAIDVGAVLYDVVALDEDGFVHGNISPEVGMPYQEKYLDAPTSGGFIKLFTGYHAAAAIDAEGRLSVWGYYTEEGGRRIIDVPENLPPVKDVALTEGAIAVVCEDGKIYMWGPKSSTHYQPSPAGTDNTPGGNSGNEPNTDQTFAFPDLCWQSLGYAQRALADIPATIVDIRYIYAPNMSPGMVVGQWPAVGDVFSQQTDTPVAVSLHVTTNTPS